MADRKERGLPKPPGQRKAFGGEAGDERERRLMADDLAEAAARGKLEEFMEKEFSGSEAARALAAMMMGMTGMLPPEGVSPEGPAPQKPGGPEKEKAKGPAGGPPADVVEAATAGDAGRLMGLLEREHRKRAGGGKGPGGAPPKKKAGEAKAAQGPAAGPLPEDSAAKHVAEELARIARENGLSVDWVVFRALKLYVEDYGRSGRL
ncbi:MAG: hypothetical protein Kow0025_20650 [Thermodesulfovibrionales bacterium]